jgi:hypothetical protein
MISGAPQPDTRVEQLRSSQELDPTVQPGELREHDAQAKESGARPDGRTGRDTQRRNATDTASMANDRLGNHKNVRTRTDHSQHVDSENATEHNDVVHTVTPTQADKLALRY